MLSMSTNRRQQSNIEFGSWKFIQSPSDTLLTPTSVPSFTEHVIQMCASSNEALLVLDSEILKRSKPKFKSLNDKGLF